MNNEDDTFDLPCTVVSSGESRSTERGFRFRELLVQTRNRRFPQTVPIQFSGRRVDAVGMLKEGDEILITASLRGHAFNGRHYVQVEGWKIQRYDAAGNLYVVAPPDVAQPTLFQAPAAAHAPSAPSAQPEPYSATRAYRPGDRAIIEGKVWIYQEKPGAAPWTLAPDDPANSTPSGSLDDLPF